MKCHLLRFANEMTSVIFSVKEHKQITRLSKLLRSNLMASQYHSICLKSYQVSWKFEEMFTDVQHLFWKTIRQ